MIGNLQGKVALVTGGGQGIGEGIARRFAQAGASVLIATRTAKNGQAVADSIVKQGGKASLLQTDIGNHEEAKRAVAHAVEKYGRLDIVVHNAAVYPVIPIEQLSDEDLDRTLSVNLKAGFWLIQAALPHLRESRHAAILNVVSAGAFIFSPIVSMYSAAKAAMVSFTRSMAAEFASQGIRVNALAPGSVDTDMVRGNPPEFIDAMKASAFMGRIADPSEMIGPALLLVSDAGSFITGQTIIADGGMVAR